MDKPKHRPLYFGALTRQLFSATPYSTTRRATQTGSGRVTVHTHEHYIHDPNRIKWHKRVSWCKRPPFKI